METEEADLANETTVEVPLEEPFVLGPPVGYTDLLDYEIEEKLKAEKEQKKKGEGKFHPLRPSNAGVCGRKLAHDLMEYRGLAWYDDPTIDPALYRLFELGHAIEYNVLRMFHLVKVVEQRYKQQVLEFFTVEREDASLPKEILEGRCDFVFWSDKYKAIGDVKSKKDKFSQAYKTGWDEELAKFQSFESLVQITDTAFYADDLELFIEELGPDDYLNDNLYQLNMYAHSDFMVSRGIDHCFLYRYNKNDSRHMEIRFRPSRAMYEKVKAKFNAVARAVDKKDPALVEKDFFLGSMRCAYCPRKTACWGDADALRLYWRSQPKKWPTDISDPFLAEQFAAFEEVNTLAEDGKRHETAILKQLVEQDIHKVRLGNGNVYEVKCKKTPKLHYYLKRSKA